VHLQVDPTGHLTEVSLGELRPQQEVLRTCLTAALRSGGLMCPFSGATTFVDAAMVLYPRSANPDAD